ncbi:hypothetical protein ABYF32_05435 [Buchananella felis]|uniref:hypothetical protein n=1 Tax=Buchananella felis TaxID=3231492 RepID=UPI003529A240
MVATLVKLRFRLLANALSQSTARLILAILGGLYGLFLLAAMFLAAFFAGDESVSVAHTALTLVGGAIVLGWATIPLLASGIDNTLDPRNFAPFTSASPRLALGLLLAGGMGIPGLITALILALPILTWARAAQPAAIALAVVMWPLVTLSSWLLARVGTTFFAGAGRSRKGRDRNTMVLMVLLVPLMGIGFVLPGLMENISGGLLIKVATVLAWTPFGAGFAAPGSLATGAIGAAVAQVAITAVTTALLWWAWLRLLPSAMLGAPLGRAQADLAAVQRHLDTPVDQAPATPQAGQNAAVGGASSSTAKRSWALADALAKLPGIDPVTAVIAERSLRYKYRDPRWLSLPVLMVGFSALMIAAAPVIIESGSKSFGDGGGVGLAFSSLPTFLTFFIAFVLQSVHADIAYDSTAYWSHISAGVSPRAEIRGRFLASVIGYLPLVLVISLLGAWRLGLGVDGAAFVGGNVGISLAMMGMAYGVAGHFIYPVPPPGASPFNNAGMGAGGLTLVVQLVVFALMGVLSIPIVIASLFTPDTLVGQSLLGAGTVVYGILVALAGAAIGAAGLAKNQVAFLTKMRSWPKH